MFFSNYFFFQSNHSTFNLLRINLRIFFPLLSIELSQSYVHGYEINELTQVDLNFIFFIFLIMSFNIKLFDS